VSFKVMVWLAGAALLGVSVGWFLKTGCIRYFPEVNWRYPVWESVYAVCTVFVIWRFSQWDIPLISALLFTWSVLALALIDIKYLILPDFILGPLWRLGFILSLFGVFVDFLPALLGSGIAYGSLRLLAGAYYRITGRTGLGQGDVKFVGMLGAWLGYAPLLSVLLLASLVSLLAGLVWIRVSKHTYHTPIPFGPFLALGGWLHLLWPEFSCANVFFAF